MNSSAFHNTVLVDPVWLDTVGVGAVVTGLVNMGVLLLNYGAISMQRKHSCRRGGNIPDKCLVCPVGCFTCQS